MAPIRPDALTLSESVSLAESASAGVVRKPDGSEIVLGFDAYGTPREGGIFDAEGRVPLHVIRPGIGKGRGRHLYEAAMLEENSGVFTNWKMYTDHLSPEARKAAGGLPRSVRDLGGRLTETWWDPTIPANDAAGHGQGAVVGMARPVRWLREMIDDDPELVESSISASATAVKPIVQGGQRVWLVEGINPRGSVDWVTEAGAGGRIAPIIEGAYQTDEDVTLALVESLSPEELQAFRPDLVEALSKDKNADPDEDGKITMEEHGSSANNGGDVADITPEALQEALAASPSLLLEALQQSAEVQVFLSSLVEAKLEEEREEIDAQADAKVERAFQLASLEKTAHGLIAESRLPETWKGDLIARFSLNEGKPTRELDVTDKVDDNGAVEKPAAEVITEAVKAEIEKEQTRLREASSTRVRQSAPVASLTEARERREETPADGAAEKPEVVTATGEKPYWQQILSEARVPDPASAYEQL